MTEALFTPVHPGEILLKEFLKPFGLSQYRLAHGIGVHPRRINESVYGKRAITPDTALRLSHYFGLSERYWLNLQARYDLEVEKDCLEGQLEKVMLRVSPEVHTTVAATTEVSGKSINQWPALEVHVERVRTRCPGCGLRRLLRRRALTDARSPRGCDRWDAGSGGRGAPRAGR